MVKKRTIYTASDGKEFDNEKEAEEHDKKVIRESIKVYKVYYNPDLNEGRGYGDHGYVYVHANKYHEQFLEYFLCKRFGNPISFVMGTFGSNAIMQTYTYEVGEYSSAYFNYVHIRNYHALKSPIAEIEEKYKDCDQMERLHEVCMNVSGDNPWKVIDDLKWFAQTDFLADAIVVFEKHRDEQILDEWLKTHDGEDYCKYCPENAECPHGMACYGGEPIEPSCYGADMKEFLYTDSIIEDALEERYGEE